MDLRKHCHLEATRRYMFCSHLPERARNSGRIACAYTCLPPAPHVAYEWHNLGPLINFTRAAKCACRFSLNAHNRRRHPRTVHHSHQFSMLVHNTTSIRPYSTILHNTPQYATTLHNMPAAVAAARSPRRGVRDCNFVMQNAMSYVLDYPKEIWRALQPPPLPPHHPALPRPEADQTGG